MLKTKITGGHYRQILLERTRDFNREIKNKTDMINKLDNQNKELLSRLEQNESTINTMKQESKNLVIVTICVTVLVLADILHIILG